MNCEIHCMLQQYCIRKFATALFRSLLDSVSCFSSNITQMITNVPSYDKDASAVIMQSDNKIHGNNTSNISAFVFFICTKTYALNQVRIIPDLILTSYLWFLVVCISCRRKDTSDKTLKICLKPFKRVIVYNKEIKKII